VTRTTFFARMGSWAADLAEKVTIGSSTVTRACPEMITASACEQRLDELRVRWARAWRRTREIEKNKRTRSGVIRVVLRSTDCHTLTSTTHDAPSARNA